MIDRGSGRGASSASRAPDARFPFASLVAAWAIVFVAGCTTPPPTARADGSAPAPPFELGGFTVQPPVGPEWSQVPIEDGLSFQRILTGGWLQNFTLMMRVPPRFEVPVHPYDLLAVARMKAASTQRSERLELLEHAEALVSHRGLECSQARFVIHDAGPAEPDAVSNRIAGRGLFCIHPDDAHRIVEIEYSIRSLDGRLLEVDVRIGEAFLDSIRPVAFVDAKTGTGSGTR